MFTTTAAVLSEALSAVRVLTSTAKSAHALTKLVRFDATDDGQITVTSSDGVDFLTYRIAGTVTAPGSIVASYADARGFLKAVTTGFRPSQYAGIDVDLTVTETGVPQMIAAGMTTTLSLHGPGNTFPAAPHSAPVTHTITDYRQFAADLQRVTHATGTDTMLPLFTRVLVELTPDSLTLLATDRYRLATTTMEATTTDTDTARFTVPRWCTRVFTKKRGSELTIAPGKHFHTLTAGNLTATIGEHTTAYPNLTYLLKAPQRRVITLTDPAELAASLTVGADMLAKRAPDTRIQLEIDNNHLDVVLTGPDVTDTLLTTTAITTTEQVTDPEVISLNPQWMATAITDAHTGDPVQIITDGPRKPTLIHSGTYRSCIQPIYLPTHDNHPRAASLRTTN